MMSPVRTVSVFAPATVANLGCAFDVLGVALQAPGDTVHATLSRTSGVTIRSITGDDGKLPQEAAQNTAGVSSSALLRFLQERQPDEFSEIGVDLDLIKGLPIGSGLGSSSASTVAAVVATNELLGAPLLREELLPFAMEGERIASGAAHADNVAPSLLGGFVLIRSYEPLDIIRLPVPANAWFAVVTPDVEVRTSDARKVLKQTISLAAATAQWGNVGALVDGIHRNDIALMGRAMEDRVIEPERAPLIPGFAEAKRAAIQHGALGCSISGSGPSVFALCDAESVAHNICRGMVEAFLQAGMSSAQVISRVNEVGALVLSKE